LRATSQPWVVCVEWGPVKCGPLRRCFGEKKKSIRWYREKRRELSEKIKRRIMSDSLHTDPSSEKVASGQVKVGVMNVPKMKFGGKEVAQVYVGVVKNKSFFAPMGIMLDPWEEGKGGVQEEKVSKNS